MKQKIVREFNRDIKIGKIKMVRKTVYVDQPILLNFLITIGIVYGTL